MPLPRRRCVAFLAALVGCASSAPAPQPRNPDARPQGGNAEAIARPQASKAAAANPGAAPLRPPVPNKQPKDVTVHGDKRIDDYFWLRNKGTPAV